MGRKGKRRRRRRADRGSRVPPPTAPGEKAARAPVKAEVTERAAEARPEGAPRRGLFAGMAVPSPHPPLSRSLVEGLRAAGDPLLLAVAFLFLLGLWGVFAGLDRPPAPPQMAMFMAIPPVSVFSDAIQSLTALPGSFAALAVAVGVTGVRSVVLGVVLTRMLSALGGETGAPTTGTHVRRAVSLFAVNLAGLGLMLTGLLVLSGFLGQLLAFVLVSGIGLYFLAMAPVIVVSEDVPAAEALRRSFRASRLPGMRHVTLVMLYLVLTVWITSLTPTGPVPPATPSLLVWVLAMVEAFAHLAVLGAFAFRWLAIRGEVPAGRPRRGAQERGR